MRDVGLHFPVFMTVRDNGDSLATICNRLVHAARRNGSRDDASALLVLRRQWFAPLWIYGCVLAAALLAGWILL